MLDDFELNVDCIEEMEGVSEHVQLPVVCLPGRRVSIHEASLNLLAAFKKVPQEKKLYLWQEQICRLSQKNGHIVVVPIKAADACSIFEDAASFEQENSKGGRDPIICSPGKAGMILQAPVFKESLPRLRMVKNAPVLLPDNAKGCRALTSYDAEEEIYVQGKVDTVTLDDAVSLLRGALSDFNFLSDGDRSRALAAFLTPALVMGGLLKARAPIFMLQADKSQTGKGFFTDLLCAIYNEEPSIVAQRATGVGSFDETFDTALKSGRSMIVMDNLKGKLDSAHIESFMTGKYHFARTAYHASAEVKCEDYFIMATSNRFELTRDLANRSCIINIRKQDRSYPWSAFEDGNILEHIRKNQSQYLGAVFSVIREWVQQGKQHMDVCSHDFRPWCGVLDWIVQNIFKEAPLMEGHLAAQLETTVSQNLAWIQDIWECIEAQKQDDQELTAADIANCCNAEEMILDGTRERKLESLTELERKQVYSQIGRHLAELFQQIDDHCFVCQTFTLTRSTVNHTFASGKKAPIQVYRFSKNKKVQKPEMPDVKITA